MTKNGQRWGSVARDVAAVTRYKPGTVHQWLHGSSSLTPQERVAAMVRVALRHGDHTLAAKILAPIRAAEEEGNVVLTPQLVDQFVQADVTQDLELFRWHARQKDAAAIRGVLPAVERQNHWGVLFHAALRAESGL